ncbi:MAG: hypothetical protein SWE60_27045, partial [Thermodesulfobacteriota bacterium]|nr:hypothetical protein [Thermodesulfobacteriota bacterium]
MVNKASIQGPDCEGLNKTRGLCECLFFGILFLLFLVSPVAFAAVETDIVFSVDAEEHYSDNFYRGEKEEIEVYTTLM